MQDVSCRDFQTSHKSSVHEGTKESFGKKNYTRKSDGLSINIVLQRDVHGQYMESNDQDVDASSCLLF